MIFNHPTFGVFLITISVSFAQQFISQPIDKTVFLGKDVTLNCVLNSGHGSHLWIKDTILITHDYTTLSQLAEPDDSTQYTRYSVVPSKTNGYHGYSLHITNAQPQDAGVYQCLVLNGDSGLESTKSTLQVLSPPETYYPKCASDIDDLHVNVGQEVTFTCQSDGVSPAAVLKWLRDIDLTEESEASNTHAWTVTEDDEGAIFTCEGEHALWDAPQTCSVGPFKLHAGKPEVKLAGVSDVSIKSTATFVCNARYVSNHDFSWYVDGIKVTNYQERITISDPIDNNAIMRIGNVLSSDAGMNVQCKINYFGGTLTSEVVTLHVKNDPTPSSGAKNNKDEETEQEFFDAVDSGVSTSTIVGAIMGFIALMLVALIIVGIVVIRREALKMKKEQDANGENFSMRSRYVGVLRSWFFPVHEHTQKSMTSFISNPAAMDNKAFQA